jgi:hypothetical protein
VNERDNTGVLGCGEESSVRALFRYLFNLLKKRGKKQQARRHLIAEIRERDGQGDLHADLVCRNAMSVSEAAG